MGSSSLIVLLIAGAAFAAGGIAVARLFVKATKNPQKGQPYECGIPTEGSSWNQFNIGYYLYALIFLLFDVELAFLYPWAVVVKRIGMVALAEAAAHSEVQQLKEQLAAKQAEVDAMRGNPGTGPARHPYRTVLAVVLALGLGFWLGYVTLARRVKHKFGGIKVY